VSEPVTRLEIAEAVKSAFESGSADRSRIVEAAIESMARPETVAMISRLPERNYPRLNEIWSELGEVPIGV
jgi:hypothetical protein